MSTAGDILGMFGLTGDIALKVSACMIDPTSSNVQAVVNAYASNGQVPPTQLMAYLIQLNEEKHPEDTYRGAAFPWLLAGAGLVFYLISRRGR
jgi:hypothetical protein